jgi:flavin-dependent dehydrogenase
MLTRYSPIGWYFYITPLPNGEFKAVNCCSQPHVNQAKKLYYEALKKRNIIRDIIGDRKPIDTFGGYGGCNFPRSAVKDSSLYVGEAAGFQDPFRGFGMNYAIESGYLAAKSIVENTDYDRLWKNHFDKRIKTDLYRRYAMVLFGDRAIEHVFRHTNDGDEINFTQVNPSGMKGAMLRELFYRLELLRHWITGYW